MLVIYAHPNKKGHTGEILRQTEQALKKVGKNYHVMDLYKTGFDPVLKNNEHYTSGGKDISPEVKAIQEIIEKENEFIFIYPTWWNNMPAILKGFLDRVLTPHFAFRYENKIPKPLLSGKALVLSSTGSPTFAYKMYFKSRSTKILAKDTLRFCGFKTKVLTVGNCDEFNDKQKNKISKVVNKGIKFFK